MLKRIRIEVEEDSAEACVEALDKYEHSIQQQEAKRYHNLWPCDEEGLPPIEDLPWRIGVPARSFYNEELGREIIEEVIEYDSGLPGYKGRRVVRYARVDTRHPIYSDDARAAAKANQESVTTLQKMLGAVTK